MREIKNIIVPTDFSVTARNAYQYAQGLAQVLGASITVVHVKEHFIPVSEFNVAPLFEREESQLIEAMNLFLAEGQAANDRTIVKSETKIQILHGDPTSSLLTLSADPITDLIVMGTTGLQDVISKFMGSISGTIANKASCPVILVPPLAEWVPIERILYASNYESMAPDLIGAATDFARFLQADTHFVHVDDTVFEEQSRTTGVNWKRLFSLIDPALKYQTHAIHGSDTIVELKKYAAEHHIDLMVFVSKQRSFWENLFHKSITQNMALSTETPMMVLHSDDNWLQEKNSSNLNSQYKIEEMQNAQKGVAQGLRALLVNELKDIYWAEQALVKAIPKMIKHASAEELVDALSMHLIVTEEHVSRLEAVFSSLGEKPESKKCEAIAGLIEEAEEIMKKTESGMVRDAGIILAAQKIEHYEIATYGTLRTFARTLGEQKATALLQETLDQEKEADVQLTVIAESFVNEEAVTGE